MLKTLKNIFFPPLPTAMEMAVRELATAEREKLIAETDRENAIARVGFRDAQIKRLRGYIATNSSGVQQ